MKSRVAFILAVLITLSTGTSALAAGSRRFLQSVKLEQGSLVIYSDAVSEDDSITVTLGGEELPTEMQTVEQAGEPITYFCLIDVSGTMEGMPLNLTKKTLTGLGSRMRQRDNMVIATFDNEISVSRPLEAGKELDDSISRISISDGDTNLYASIIESMELLSSGQDYHTKKCLIIFSDGAECQDNGVTETEVLQKVYDADFPLYTIAAMTRERQLDGGKIMGSFSRASAGGEHFTTANEEGGAGVVLKNLSGDDIAESIWNDMSNGAVVTADLSGYTPNAARNETALNVTLCADGETLTETRNILTDDLLQAITAGAESSSAETEHNPESDVTAEKNNTVLIAVCCAAVAVIAAAVALILRRKRKQRDVQEITETELPDDFGTTVPAETVTAAAETELVQEQDINLIPVFMLEIPYGRNPVSFSISPNGEKLTVGRNDRADFVLNRVDSQLSGIHFSLLCSNEKYYAMDENSTNGTYLNGVNIAGKGWIPVVSGDKLRAGEMEYRILFGDEALQQAMK